jgi:branched-chain amino acid transport system substrate-binding protein
MRKIALFLFLALILLVGCNQGKNDSIKIGAILPLTGDAAAWGIPPKNGALLAVEQINAAGGINGKKLELVVEDDGCDPKMAVNSINKLLAANKPVAVVGAVCSASTLAIAPIVEKNKIVLISPASTHPSITDAGDYVFRVIPSDDLRAKVFAEYIASLGHKTAVVLAINNEAGKGAELSFTKYFEQQGGKVIGVENYMPDANNVKIQLTKIKELNPDIILALSQVTDAVMVLKEVKELNVKIPLFFQSEALDDPSVILNSGNAANGATYITYAKNNNEVAKSFELAYKNRFKVESNLFAPEAYDAVMLIASKLKASTEISSEKLHNELYSISEYQGASGILTFDKNGDVIKPLTICKIVDQSIKIVTSINQNK